MKVKIFIALLLSLQTLPVLSSEVTHVPTISALTALAKDAVANKIDAPSNAKVIITPQNIDGRLTPPACSSPVVVELASEREIGRNNTVKLSCHAPSLNYLWQVYISVRVEILYPVVTAENVISPGALISRDNLNIAFVDQYSLRGQFFTEIEQIIGSRVKRRVAKDAPILSGNLCFVCKGDPVSIFARTENIVIKTSGEALNDGNEGDTIRVKNSISNRELDAQVTGIGEVEVKM
jgi:flagellar basal body P-ring formation protein FlgA